MKISVVIPVYNEEKKIASTAETLDLYMKEKFENFWYYHKS